MPFAVQLARGADAQTSTEGNVRLSPAISTVPAGKGPFTVYVVLEDLQHAGNVTYDDDRDGIPDRGIPSVGLGAFEFTIEYDPAIVEFRSVERGPNLSMTGRSFQCLPAARDTGAVTFGCLSPGSSPEGAQGDLTLASVQFAPRSNGLSPLVLSAEVAGPLGDSAEVGVGGGTVRVSGASQTSKLTPDRTLGTATPRPPASTPPGGTVTSPQATASTVAHMTATAEGTPDGTATTFVRANPKTPALPDDHSKIDTNNDGSSNHLWLWTLGIAAGLACGAVGLTAILWRRRGHAGF